MRNHGGGHANHSLFWLVMSPEGVGSHKGPLGRRDSAKLGSFEEFKQLFIKAALSRFGSGWAWLVKDQQGKLHGDQQRQSRQPINGWIDTDFRIDVWEHAYYLQYQNKRLTTLRHFLMSSTGRKSLCGFQE